MEMGSLKPGLENLKKAGFISDYKIIKDFYFEDWKIKAEYLVVPVKPARCIKINQPFEDKE